MAISGEALLTSAHHIFNLLTRNTLSTLGVWWLPGTILQACAFVLAGAWGALVWLVCAAYFAGKPDATLNSVVPGVLSFLFAWAVLSFFSSILLNVIDALYICYAMDRDARAVTHADVHQVYALLPCNVGGIVEQPDGGYAYGAPQQQQQQQPSYGGYPAYAAAGGGAPAYPQQPQAYSAGAPLLHSSSAQYVPPQVPPAPGGGKNPPYV